VSAPNPNYRLYDCTGGHVTHDVHADSLAEALDLARFWLRAGDWPESSRSRVLVAEVAKIVRCTDDEATDGGERHVCSVTLDPSPRTPRTSCGEHEDDHDWSEYLGVTPAHGSTVIKTACGRCGLRRIVDGGASRPTDGSQVFRRTYETADGEPWAVEDVCNREHRERDAEGGGA